MELEVKRQLVHALGIFSILFILMFGSFYASLLMLLIAVGLVLAAEYRNRRFISKLIKIEPFKEIEDLVDNELKTYERKNELPLNGAILFFLGSFLVTAVFEPKIAIASIAVLALSDSISTLVGIYFGENKLFLNKKKSWEGSSAFFIVAFFVLLSFINPFKAFIIALLVTIVEMLPKINDNLSVPISTAILLSLMINI